jgi:hypothetical protein
MREKKPQRDYSGYSAAVIGLVLLGGCVAAAQQANDTKAADPPGVASGKTEGGGTASYNADDKMACQHAHNILVDVNEGILTVSELRGKISEVRDDAETPAVKKAATEMLAAITSGSGVASATTGLISACKLV